MSPQWGKWPDANVAVATGAASGLVAFDVDVKNGKDGKATARELKLKSGLVAQTPTGGRHYFYKWPGRKVGSPTDLRDGLDIRGDGAYVVVAPSIVDGVEYKWLHEEEEAALSPELSELLFPSKARREGDSSGETIPEGKRNSTIFRRACQLRDAGLEHSEIEAACQVINTRRCDPPMDPSEVSSIVTSACSREASPDDARVKSSELIRLIDELHCELFTDGLDAYASLVRDGHMETYELEGPDFAELLSSEIYKRDKRIASEQAVSEAVTALRGRARFDGLKHDVSLRAARTADGYCVDLVDQKWGAVVVKPSRVEIVRQPPLRFRRNSTSRELAIDLGAKKENLKALLSTLLNVRESDLPLVVTWMLDAWRPDTAYPILEVTGEQGSSKSTTQDRIRNLVDPNAAPLLTAPRSADDIVIHARTNLVLSYNNLSGLKRDDQDLLCSVSTGGAVTVRKLYTNYAASTVNLKRPIILNGIESVGTNPDFVDRVVSIDLPPIPQEKRRTDAELSAEFERLRAPAIGALLDLFAAALERLPSIALVRLPRMADFAKLGEAVCSVMDWPSFSDLYAQNQRYADLATLDASPAARALQDFMETANKPFSGTCKDLYLELLRFRPDGNSNWPHNEKGLSGQLRRYAPVLRHAGIEVRFDDTRTNRGRRVRVRQLDGPSQQSQPTHAKRAA